MNYSYKLGQSNSPNIMAVEIHHRTTHSMILSLKNFKIGNSNYIFFRVIYIHDKNYKKI